MDVGHCEPWWVTDGLKTCPYGTPLIGDVTLPNNLTGVAILAVIYGYVPYVFSLLFLVRFIWKRGTRDVANLLFILFLFILNELILKEIINEHRPGQEDRNATTGSCLSSCGMPSSHSAMALAFYVLLLTDAFCQTLRVYTDHIPMRRNYLFLNLILMIVLLPVPVSRVVVNDHSFAQIFAGGGSGMVASISWLFALQFLQHRWAPKYGQTLLEFKGFTLIRHDLPPSFLFKDDVNKCKRQMTQELLSNLTFERRASTLEPRKGMKKKGDAGSKMRNQNEVEREVSDVSLLEAKTEVKRIPKMEAKKTHGDLSDECSDRSL